MVLLLVLVILLVERVIYLNFFLLQFYDNVDVEEQYCGLCSS